MKPWLWRLARFFLFRLDAERAHRLTVELIRLGLRWGRFGGRASLRVASGASGAAPLPSVPPTVPHVFGLPFLSRVGLAAGFDKDAELVAALPDLGFGFVEIGTVTPRPQPGSEKPRLFRDPKRESIFNRMGFNGSGAARVAERLSKARASLPPGFRVGINVGKNKDTPLEKAARDYALAVVPFEGLVDYLVINVSSPNTAGLRSLQTREALKPIVSSVKELIQSWDSSPPLLLKLAPELGEAELHEIIRDAERWGIEGWVLTNTLGGERGPLSGGWSGRVLTELARKSLRAARASTQLPIISVGGIMDADEAALRIQWGADLIQIYSGWIYRGPAFPREIAGKIN